MLPCFGDAPRGHSATGARNLGVNYYCKVIMTRVGTAFRTLVPGRGCAGAAHAPCSGDCLRAQRQWGRASKTCFEDGVLEAFPVSTREGTKVSAHTIKRTAQCIARGGVAISRGADQRIRKLDKDTSTAPRSCPFLLLPFPERPEPLACVHCERRGGINSDAAGGGARTWRYLGV